MYKQVPDTTGVVRAGQGPSPMSSQSTARASLTRIRPQSRPVTSVAYRYGWSPESLWVHSTPGYARLTATPELSVSRGLWKYVDAPCKVTRSERSRLNGATPPRDVRRSHRTTAPTHRCQRAVSAESRRAGAGTTHRAPARGLRHGAAGFGAANPLSRCSSPGLRRCQTAEFGCARENAR